MKKVFMFAAVVAMIAAAASCKCNNEAPAEEPACCEKAEAAPAEENKIEAAAEEAAANLINAAGEAAAAEIAK